MGFYPKHLKVRRYRWNMRIIATAGISGCMFERVQNHLNTPYQMGWLIHYNDGQISHMFDNKSHAASAYLLWWFDKQGVWPRRRIA